MPTLHLVWLPYVPTTALTVEQAQSCQTLPRGFFAKPRTPPRADSILAVLEGKVAKWWMPDRVEFVESLPMTATGKLWKAELKREWKDFSLEG